jgi:hypothetical protein
MIDNAEDNNSRSSMYVLLTDTGTLFTIGDITTQLIA